MAKLSKTILGSPGSLEEFRSLIASVPTLDQWLDVAESVEGGRFLVAAKDLDPSECFCEEAAFVSWPVDLRALKANEQHDDATTRCAVVEPGHYELIFPDLPWKTWAEWQASRSPKSFIGLVALAHCLCQIAEQMGALMHQAAGLEVDAALDAALRPYERLCTVPKNSGLAFHNTTVEEIFAELKKSCALHPLDRLPAKVWENPTLLLNLAERLSQNALKYSEKRAVRLCGRLLGRFSLGLQNPLICVKMLLSTSQHHEEDKYHLVDHYLLRQHRF